MSTIKYIAAAVLAGTLLAGGCSSDSSKEPQPVVRGMSRKDSDALNAGHSRFEQTQDEAINAQTHFAAGQLAESQGAADRAIEQYRAALRVNPTHLPSLYRLGILHAQAGSYPQAIAVWSTYVRESREDAMGYSNLGYCHELAGHPAEAEANYKKGIARDPKNVPCRVNYGLMLARAGRTNEAILQLQTVLPPEQVHYNLGAVYEQVGKKDQAKLEYRKAIDIDPGMKEAQARLAAIE